MSTFADRALSTVLTAAAVTIAGALVHREFRPPTARPAPAAAQAHYVPRWKEALNVGVADGPDDAKITIVTFNDLECPFCRSFHQTLRELRASNPRDIRTVFVHFPLPSHRFALPAARVAECAAREGKFASTIDAIYEQQDSLGLTSWGHFASAGGVRDTAAVARCALDTKVVSRIQSGSDIGGMLQIRSTPSVLVNGWLLVGTPPAGEITRVISALRNGKAPFDSAGNPI